MTRAPGLLLGIAPTFRHGTAGWDVAVLVLGAQLLLAGMGRVRRPREA
jgi:hypothetical protein